MKYINIFSALALTSAAMLATSCNDVLDVNEESKLSDLAVWSSTSAADSYVTASYKGFTDDTQLAGCRNRFWDSYGDLTKSSSWDQYGHPYNKTMMQPSSFSGDAGAGAFEIWSATYERIRRANICLRDLHEYGSKFGSEFVQTREAEIRLCRAFAYFRLARVYGGVVIRTDKTGKNGVDDGAYPEDVVRARASEADTYKFILTELKEAAEALPEEYSGVWPKGRALRAFAYGLMSRIALYAQDWDTAIMAAEKVMEYENYNGKAVVGLADDYASLFTPEGANSNEYLFVIQYMKGSLTHQWDYSVSPGGDNLLNNGAAYAEHQPTAELCDLYEFKDGEPFDWSTWDAKHSDPFTDREPRFHATVLYNGASWRGRKIDVTPGGLDGFKVLLHTGSTGGASCTGYFLRKHLQEDNLEFTVDQSWAPDPIMRYAEVLLNAAEAYIQADLVGNSQKALDCINRIRKRVGLPVKTQSDVANIDDFMKLIREERAKELAAEGFRFWDLRRWRLATTVLNNVPMHGVKVTASGNGFKYERVEVDGGDVRIFPERYYYFSIPMSERSNNPACENNPMW